MKVAVILSTGDNRRIKAKMRVDHSMRIVMRREFSTFPKIKARNCSGEIPEKGLSNEARVESESSVPSAKEETEAFTIYKRQSSRKPKRVTVRVVAGTQSTFPNLAQKSELRSSPRVQ